MRRDPLFLNAPGNSPAERRELARERGKKLQELIAERHKAAQANPEKANEIWTPLGRVFD